MMRTTSSVAAAADGPGGRIHPPADHFRRFRSTSTTGRPVAARPSPIHQYLRAKSPRGSGTESLQDRPACRRGNQLRRRSRHRGERPRAPQRRHAPQPPPPPAAGAHAYDVEYPRARTYGPDPAFLHRRPRGRARRSTPFHDHRRGSLCRDVNPRRRPPHSRTTPPTGPASASASQSITSSRHPAGPDPVAAGQFPAPVRQRIGSREPEAAARTAQPEAPAAWPSRRMPHLLLVQNNTEGTDFSTFAFSLAAGSQEPVKRIEGCRSSVPGRGSGVGVERQALDGVGVVGAAVRAALAVVAMEARSSA